MCSITGSEMDEDEMVVSESEDSNDSWTTEEFSSEFIMRYGSRWDWARSRLLFKILKFFVYLKILYQFCHCFYVTSLWPTT